MKRGSALLAAAAFLLAAAPLLFAIKVDCRPCGGRGAIVEWVMRSLGTTRSYPCPACDATGRIRLSRRLAARLASASDLARLPALSSSR